MINIAEKPAISQHIPAKETEGKPNTCIIKLNCFNKNVKSQQKWKKVQHITKLQTKMYKIEW